MNKIKNRIIKITEENFLVEFNEINAKYNTYKVEVDGEKIQTWEDYITVVQDEFKFPTACLDSMDRYVDWITDLSWLDKTKPIEAYILIIRNYNSFLSRNDTLKNLIITSFVDHILPFWEEDIKQMVIEGETRIFCVYLLEN